MNFLENQIRRKAFTFEGTSIRIIPRRNRHFYHECTVFQKNKHIIFVLRFYMTKKRLNNAETLLLSGSYDIVITEY